MTAGEVLGRNFSYDPAVEIELSKNLKASPFDDGTISALCEGWPNSTALQDVVTQLNQRKSGLPTSLAFKLMSVASDADQLVQTLVWASLNFQGDLWEAAPFWLPSVVTRIKEDDSVYAKMNDSLLTPAGPGVKASFPRMMGRARGSSDELRLWCQTECRRAEDDLVAEVGFDLVAGQQRFVVQSLFDLLADTAIV